MLNWEEIGQPRCMFRQGHFTGEWSRDNRKEVGEEKENG
jgi:hypothetical protein